MAMMMMMSIQMIMMMIMMLIVAKTNNKKKKQKILAHRQKIHRKKHRTNDRPIFRPSIHSFKPTKRPIAHIDPLHSAIVRTRLLYLIH